MISKTTENGGMSDLGFMRVGDIWRNKKAKTRIIEITDIKVDLVNSYAVVRA